MISIRDVWRGRLLALAVAVAALLPLPALADAPPVTDRSAAGELTYWNLVKDAEDPEGLERYIEAFPNGMFIDPAGQRYRQLTGKDIVPRGGAPGDGVATTEAGAAPRTPTAATAAPPVKNAAAKKPSLRKKFTAKKTSAKQLKSKRAKPALKTKTAKAKPAKKSRKAKFVAKKPAAKAKRPCTSSVTTNCIPATRPAVRKSPGSGDGGGASGANSGGDTGWN